MVFYALTPILLICYEKNKKNWNLLLIVSFLLTVFFAFVYLDDKKSLDEQCDIYISPFNNIFLYLSGIAIYFNLKNLYIKPIIILIVFFSAASIFLFYPEEGDKITIITGASRIIFSLASIMVVCFFINSTTIIIFRNGCNIFYVNLDLLAMASI